MRGLKISLVAAAAAACFTVVVPEAGAQVSVSIGLAPECPYGYYDATPYGCAPAGYYGPEWFSGGVFIDGAGTMLSASGLVADAYGNKGLTFTGTAGIAVPLIRLLEIPQPMRPGQSDRGAHHRPILILDLVIDLGAHPRGGDRA